jgi:cyclopropane-fatty-acyl-phospholipid synthase
MNSAAQIALDFTERGWVPDAFIRRGVRQLVRDRLREIRADDCELNAAEARQFVAQMDDAVIAPLAEKANEQHYELPPQFFAHVLGPHRKYSCCYWPKSVESLDAAEDASLRVTAERGELGDGMRILELGCGWGSLTLWMASRYPKSEIVSVEMFEHMRNYRELFRRIACWLKPGGKFFMHIFCHRNTPYTFEDKGPSDWMSRYFFSGGIMPCDDLPLRFQEHLKFSKLWRWSGKHYERTANAWLRNMDRRRELIWPILEKTYGEGEALRWWVRWRLFFIACAELFGHENGQQWWVSHYLFERRAS